MFWNFYFLTDINHETSCPLVTESFCVGKIIEGDCLLAIDKEELIFLGSDSEVIMQSRETTLGEEMFTTN